MQILVKWRETGKERKLVQILVLMQVCRAFRIAVFESDAFLDWYFDFAYLVAGWRNAFWMDTRPPETIFRVARIVHTLLADANLVRTLACKRDWLFCEPPDVLLAVLAGIPTFRDSIQKVCIGFAISPIVP
jgi:hypothetical protein